MKRQPDPAAGTPAARVEPEPKGDGTEDTTCAVRRAATDTGFVVVCE